jgi:predicted transcriptional regulator
LPTCGTDNRIKGMLTDRDIVVKVLGAGKDPAQCPAGDLAQGEAVTIGADDDAEEILETMTEHKVRRLPVIDGHDLVGIDARQTWPARCPTRRWGSCCRCSPAAEPRGPWLTRSKAEFFGR